MQKQKTSLVLVSYADGALTGTAVNLQDILKATIWLNATPIPGKDIALWRQDPCGAQMYWHDYGKANSKHGWEIDHILPVMKGGTDDMTNLQALHWKNNRQKADDVGVNYCVVTE